jgi:hypothetical protein
MSLVDSPLWFFLFFGLIYIMFVYKKRKRDLKNIQKKQEYKSKIKENKSDVEEFDGTGKGFAMYYPPQEKYCDNKVFPGSYLTPYDMTRSRECECSKLCNNNNGRVNSEK